MEIENAGDTGLTPEENAFFESGGEVPEDVGEGDQPETAETNDAPATDPEPEGEEGAQVDDGAVKPPPGFVQIGALHEARAQNRELRESLQREAARVAQFESLRAELDEIRRSKAQETQESIQAREQKMRQEAEERYQEDPVGYLREQNALLQQQIAATQEQQRYFQESQQRSIQEAQQMRALTQHIDTLEQEFRSKIPEYDDAFRFVQERRLRDLQAIGISDPNQQRQALYQEIFGMSGRAIQEGRNPAEVVYSLAKAWGFQPQEPLAGIPGAEPTPAGKPAGKLERIQRGQQVATSLSDSGGAPAPGELSLTDIERMSDAEFDKLWGEMEKNSR